MIKSTIRFKVLITFVSLLIVALGATDYLWYNLVKPILTERLATVQMQLASRGADKIDQYLNAEQRALIIHSQSAPFLTQNKDLQKLELYTLFTQDRDIERLTFIDPAGKETISLTPAQEMPISQLKDRSRSESFVGATFQYGNVYYGPVLYKNGRPTITMTVPIVVPNTSQSLSDLTTATKRSRRPGEILGVLEATINLTSLLNDVTTLGSNDSGILYIVNKSGHIIAHENKHIAPLIDASSLKPVKSHIIDTQNGNGIATSQNRLVEYKDLQGVPVLGSYVSILKTGWAVIVEQPVAVTNAELDTINRFALLLMIIGLFVALPVSYIFSRRLTRSIAILVKGTEIIGQGNFDYNPPVKSHDEIADLADAFYRMAQELKHSIQSLQKERDILEEERNKLSIIIAGIQDAVIAVDLKRQITLINRAAEELLSVRGFDVLGKPITDVLNLQNGTEKIDVTEYCPINPEEHDGVVFAKDNLKLTKNNASELYINVVTGKIKGGAATNLGCIMTLHNVSKEMQLEEMKLDFVSMAAHELRTPLTAITGYLSVFIMENKDKFDEEQKSFLNRISISTQRLISLVENLLNVTKIERHGMSLTRKPVDWVPHVKELMVDFENMAREQKIELRFDEPTEPIPPITIDSLKVDEVLSNLINNAINYSKSGGHVHVVIEHHGNEVITSVKDDGPGIPETAIPHLFTKFFRVSGSLEQGSKGTGLGLYISKAIIEMHSGRIWAESQLGHGSTFSFALPVDKDS